MTDEPTEDTADTASDAPEGAAAAAATDPAAPPAPDPSARATPATPPVAVTDSDSERDGDGDGDGEVTMVLWRGDTEGGEFTEYKLPAVEGEVVLDVIHRVQATHAPDLACRWNCKAGKCGSCSAEINGKPALMCMTRMSELPEGEDVVVAPLRTFPIIRDLVTDVSYNYEVAKRIPPFNPRAKTDDEVEAGGYRMAQIDVERSQEFRKCIECYLCQDVCHVIRDHEENKTSFAGPRFFARSAELEMHPLDTTDRRAILQAEQGLGKCNITKCCTEVCPEHIKITDNAIIPLKERVVDAQYDPVAWLGRKIRGRKKGTVEAAAATNPAGGPAAVQSETPARGIPGPGGYDEHASVEESFEVVPASVAAAEDAAEPETATDPSGE
jgi:succinate dehydrogenase / fumarate reductase iron-sulfur subunit